MCLGKHRLLRIALSNTGRTYQSWTRVSSYDLRIIVRQEGFKNLNPSFLTRRKTPGFLPCEIDGFSWLPWFVFFGFFFFKFLDVLGVFPPLYRQKSSQSLAIHLLAPLLRLVKAPRFVHSGDPMILYQLPHSLPFL